jgi:hypothetical protein
MLYSRASRKTELPPPVKVKTTIAYIVISGNPHNSSPQARQIHSFYEITTFCNYIAIHSQ